MALFGPSQSSLPVLLARVFDPVLNSPRLACSEPAQLSQAHHSVIYIYAITFMLPANIDDAIRQLEEEK
jgi:hypothetical protein